MRSITANGLVFGYADRNISCVRNAKSSLLRRTHRAGHSGQSGANRSRKKTCLHAEAKAAAIPPTSKVHRIPLRCTFITAICSVELKNGSTRHVCRCTCEKEIMKADTYKARLKFLQEQNICVPGRFDCLYTECRAADCKTVQTAHDSERPQEKAKRRSMMLWRQKLPSEGLSQRKQNMTMQKRIRAGLRHANAASAHRAGLQNKRRVCPPCGAGIKPALALQIERGR